MSGAREGVVATLALDLRGPLARIELAASQLGREAGTPAARRLSDDIRDAVADLDRRIGRVLSILAPPGSRGAGDEDLGPLLAQLRNRLEPVLAARGVSWHEAPHGAPDVRGDAGCLRALAVALLRGGAAAAGAGGSVSLSLRVEPDRAGIALCCRRADGRAPERDAWRELRPLALARGAGLEVGSEDVTIWLPSGEAT